MTERSRLLIDVMCNVLEILFNLMLKFATPFFTTEKELKIRPFATDGKYIYFGTAAEPSTIDSRIQKIDSARAGLTEALSAMDELKEIAETNKRDLALLNSQIRKAEEQRENVSSQLTTLKSIAALDSEAVRTVLKLPTRISVWTERVFAFAFGVISSIIASYLYDYFVKPHL